MAEIVEFRVPSGNDQTLLVLGLESDASEASNEEAGLGFPPTIHPRFLVSASFQCFRALFQ